MKVGQACVCCKCGSELSRLPSRHCLDTLSIRHYSLIDFNPLISNAKIFESWYNYAIDYYYYYYYYYYSFPLVLLSIHHVKYFHFYHRA